MNVTGWNFWRPHHTYRNMQQRQARGLRSQKNLSQEQIIWRSPQEGSHTFECHSIPPPLLTVRIKAIRTNASLPRRSFYHHTPLSSDEGEMLLWARVQEAPARSDVRCLLNRDLNHKASMPPISLGHMLAKLTSLPT